MNIFTSILLSFIFFLIAEVVPGSKIYACGNNKICCKMMGENGSKSKCCCLKDLQKTKSCNKHQKKGGNCNDKDCPCPQLDSNIQLGSISNQLVLDLADNFLSCKIAWFHIQEFPTVIYLSIWLKPKICYIYFG